MDTPTFVKSSPQAFRNPTDGPDEIVCMVFDKESGREITKVKGRKTGKYKAEHMARLKALRQAKKNLGRRWKSGELEILFKSV